MTAGDDNQGRAFLPSLGDFPAWILWVDGTALPNPGRVGIGLVLQSPSGDMLPVARDTGLRGCNNEAELHALITGLTLAESQGAQHLMVYSDSDFVVRHVRGEQHTRIPRLLPLIETARRALAKFPTWSLAWLPKHRNQTADTLARSALGLTAKIKKHPGRRTNAKGRR